MEKNIKVSFVATFLNEENSIEVFIDSLLAQTKIPDKIILVDGGSTDRTIAKIKQKKKLKNLQILIQRGNRSVGRNFGIKKAKYDYILVSDVGCILKKDWVERMTRGFEQGVDVVAGYYLPKTKNVFEKTLATYTCVMPNKLDPATYLPSSRSIGFTKSAWRTVGGYPEYLNTCEDLVFARRLKKAGFRFKVLKDALVYWPQQSTYMAAFHQFFGYAVGDGEALYIRSQTPLLYLRYFLGLLMLAYFVSTKNIFALYLFILIHIFYALWAVAKNYRYVRHARAFYILPILQYVADVAVLSGMTLGIVKYIQKKL